MAKRKKKIRSVKELLVYLEKNHEAIFGLIDLVGSEAKAYKRRAAYRKVAATPKGAEAKPTGLTHPSGLTLMTDGTWRKL